MSELEDICRELAERTVQREASVNDHIYGETTAVPDPRFEALRGEHDVDGGGRGVSCHGCDWEGNEGEGPATPYCLDTSLGSIVRAAAAYGFGQLVAVVYAIREAYQVNTDTYNSWEWHPEPELAAARALKEAVNGR